MNDFFYSILKLLNSENIDPLSRNFKSYLCKELYLKAPNSPYRDILILFSLLYNDDFNVPDYYNIFLSSSNPDVLDEKYKLKLIKILVWLEQKDHKNVELHPPEIFNAENAFRFIRTGNRSGFYNFIQKHTEWEYNLFNPLCSNSIDDFKLFQKVDFGSCPSSINSDILLLIKSIGGNPSFLSTIIPKQTFYDKLWISLYSYLTQQQERSNDFTQDVMIENQMQYFILEIAQKESTDDQYSISTILKRWVDPEFWNQYIFVQDNTDPKNLEHIPLIVHLNIIEFYKSSENWQNDIMNAIDLFLSYLIQQTDSINPSLLIEYAKQFCKDPYESIIKAFSNSGSFNKLFFDAFISNDGIIPIKDDAIKIQNKIIANILSSLKHSQLSPFQRRAYAKSALSWTFDDNIVMKIVYTLAEAQDLEGALSIYSISQHDISKSEQRFWESLQNFLHKKSKDTVQEAKNAAQKWSEINDKSSDNKSQKDNLLHYIFGLLSNEWKSVIDN